MEEQFKRVEFSQYFKIYKNVFKVGLKQSFLKMHNTLAFTFVLPPLIVGTLLTYINVLLKINTIDTVSFIIMLIAFINYFSILLITRYNNKNILQKELNENIKIFLSNLFYIFEDKNNYKYRLIHDNYIEKYSKDIFKNIKSINLKQLIFLYGIIISFANNHLDTINDGSSNKTFTKEEKLNALKILEILEKLIIMIDGETSSNRQKELLSLK